MEKKGTYMLYTKQYQRRSGRKPDNRVIRLLGYSIIIQLFLFSCTSNEVPVPDKPAGIEQVSLSIPITRSPGDNPENDILTARMIVVRSLGQDGGGKVLANNNTPVRVDDETVAFNDMVQIGKIDIYFFANELAAWNLASITSGSTMPSLSDKVLTYSSSPYYGPATSSTGIPMYAYYQQLEVNEEGEIEGDANRTFLMERLYAKVLLNLVCNFDNIGGREIELENVAVKGMPTQSWLLAANYSGNAFNDGAAQSPLSFSALPDPGEDGFMSTYRFYIPEYLVSDKTKYSYLYIGARLKDNPAVKYSYELVLGNGMATRTFEEMYATDISLSDLTVSRNTCYTLTANIIGFGSANEIKVNLGAEEWTPVTVENNLAGRMLNVSDIAVTVSATTDGRIYFWSNQKDVDVSVDTNGYTGTINKTYSYNTGTSSGVGTLTIPYTGAPQGTYTIYLNAGGLRREITVTIS